MNLPKDRNLRPAAFVDGLNRRHLSILLIIALGVFLQALPKYFQDYLVVGGAPLHSIAFFLVFIFCIFLAITHETFKALDIKLILITIVWGSALAIFFNHSPSFRWSTFCMDLALVVGILSALMLRHIGSPLFFARLYTTVFILCVFSLAGSIILLKLGIIQGAQPGGRVFDISMYYTASVSALLCPAVLSFFFARKLRITGVVLFVSWFSVTTIFAEMSATRSVLLIAIVSALLSLFLIAVKKGRVVSFTLFIFVTFFCAALASLLAGTSLQMDNLTERVDAVGFVSEDRLLEAEYMFDALGGFWVTGRGFGAGFFSQITSLYNPEGFAIATHIGVLSFMFKLGVVGVGVFVVTPLIFAIRRLISHTTMESGACAAGILVYFAQSSISGGFHYTYTFVGALLFSGLLYFSKYEDVRKSIRPTIVR